MSKNLLSHPTKVENLLYTQSTDFKIFVTNNEYEVQLQKKYGKVKRRDFPKGLLIYG